MLGDHLPTVHGRSSAVSHGVQVRTQLALPALCSSANALANLEWARVSLVMPAASPTGEIIGGRYLIERMLGQGGMGAVYVAIDTGSLRRVALKRLASPADPKTVALFEQEYYTLAGLRHPCIVESYEYGADEHGAFYTMELIQGGELSRQAPMPWRHACECLRDLSSILGLLHARRLVYRDLNPRNLLRTQSGKLKLIDFGALLPFGPSPVIVGTPPFLAPEALEGKALDQRSDLFSLGALGYFLLTGVHAFPAKNLNELPRLWEHPPRAPSSVLALRKDPALEPCPAELDELLRALLQAAPEERPARTGEVIERLNAIADLEPESDALAARGYLASKTFVGRTRERERVLSKVRSAAEGNAQSLLIGGEPGIGRTRLLDELSVLVRLEGAATLRTDSSLRDRPLGAAQALTLRLVHALPEHARRAAAAHGAIFDHLPEELRTKLGIAEREGPTPTPTSEQRVRLRQALCDLFLAVAEERLIALLLDDLQGMDEDSQAFVTLLADRARSEKLLIVATHRRELGQAPSPAFSRFRNHAEHAHLLPLTIGEVHELLRSIFGETPYLERLSERLRDVSEGNPAHCFELAEHLVQSGMAYYEDGMWVLPRDVALEQLPKTRSATRQSRVGQLSVNARALARALSAPHDHALSSMHCLRVSGLDAMQTAVGLAELQRQGVLNAVEGEFRFVDEEVRAALYDELSPTEREAIHVALAKTVLGGAGSDKPIEKLRAAVHFLRGGQATTARALLQDAEAQYAAGDISLLSGAAPLLEQLYTLLRDSGHDAYALVTPLTLLSLSGHVDHRRYAMTYGELNVSMLEQVLRLPLARKLSRFIGRKGALAIALTIAFFCFRRRRPGPSVADAVRYMLASATSLTAVAATCLDAKGSRYPAMIEPLTALGHNHAANVLHALSECLALRITDDHSESVRRMRQLITRLESDTPIRRLPDLLKRGLAASCHLSLGVTECWRDGPDALQRADKLEQYGALFEMAADSLRATYWASQGDSKRAAHFRRRLEEHEMVLGGTWQAETWASNHAIITALRTYDAPAMKRAARDLSRLAQDTPSLVPLARRARGGYLLLVGKYTQALALLENDSDARGISGYSHGRGMLARALNALGRHGRAREVASEALALLSAGELSSTAMHLPLQIELALAESALENHTLAASQLDRLIAQHTPAQGTITLGSLHEARALVALAVGSRALARVHLEQMDGWYRPTGAKALIERVAALTRKVTGEQTTNHTDEFDIRLLDDTFIATRLQVLRAQGGSLLLERAQQGLQVALELSKAVTGFIVLPSSQDGVVYLGSEPAAEALVWAREQLAGARHDEDTVLTGEIDSVMLTDHFAADGLRYRLVLLWKPGGHDALVAALLLGFEGELSRMPPPEVLSAIAGHLAPSVRASLPQA